MGTELQFMRFLNASSLYIKRFLEYLELKKKIDLKAIEISIEAEWYSVCQCLAPTSVISWNNSSGIVMVVMLCLTAVCRAFLKPTITGFLVLIVGDFTLSSTTRWNTTCTSDKFECRVM